jgi:hypothetical protein
MTPREPTAEEGFAALIDALGDMPGVSKPDAPAGSGGPFGSSALRVQGRIFAMVTRGQLVLKLPQGRVAELISAGRGGPFDAGKGRPMKEWVSLDPMRQEGWLDLATEAMDFVGSKRRGGSPSGT